MKKLKNDNAGITLAELVVTFALMGIFLAAAAAVISSSIMVHAQLSGTMYASTVSETLLDKVTGELAGARAEEEEAIRIGRDYRDGEELSEGVSF
ncbi:prepilin-type N-terminal cleavage/methylation domain-containing protein [Suilimivivens sp.]|uniref:prepilin-type N-terminal cleavage/methylation domain-containing protein n=1 Tax=Suilimivivens sp. TaxID=2981669 RepID=UPI003077F53B